MVDYMPVELPHRFSLEATRPNAAEIAALAEILPPGTPVYFSAVPTITPPELIAAAALLRKSGLEPVVHIAARRHSRCRRPAETCSPVCAARPMCAGFW